MTKVVTRSVKIEVFLTPASVALSKLTLSDSDVPVGTMVNATVTLTNAAPSGGAKVLLSSLQSTVAKVQSTSVTIPKGQKSASFQVRAESAGTAVIKGTYNGSKTATLKVGGPVIVIEPPKPPPPPRQGRREVNIHANSMSDHCEPQRRDGHSFESNVHLRCECVRRADGFHSTCGPYRADKKSKKTFSDSQTRRYRAACLTACFPGQSL